MHNAPGKYAIRQVSGNLSFELVNFLLNLQLLIKLVCIEANAIQGSEILKGRF